MSADTKQCPSCGAQIEAEARICRSCGARFDVTIKGYCPTCHGVVQADENGACRQCGETLFDRGSMSARSGAIADLAGEPWALLHPDDASRTAVQDGDPVVIASRRGSIALRARVSAAILPGQVFVPRGYDAAPVNALIDLTDAVTRVRVAGL